MRKSGWLPVLLLPMLLAAYGLALGLGGAGGFLARRRADRPVRLPRILFASAVFYPLSKIPPEAWLVLKYNPLLLTIEAARDVVFWNRPLNLLHLGYLYGCGVVAYLIGSAIFQRLRGSFSDVL